MNGNANESIGDLRARREAAGLSQEALARRAECSTSMVRLLERGYLPQSGEVLRRVDAVLSGELDLVAAR